LSDPAEYDLAILQALEIYRIDRPNLRVVDQVLAAAGFRFVLAGSGALAGLTGANAWVDGVSQLEAVYAPWNVTVQGQEPLDANIWRVVRDPAAIVLELLDRSLAVGDTVRLVFTARHTLVEAPGSSNTPVDADEDALGVLTASLILELAAVRAAQNTGNTGLPNDIVDRRTQSDVFRSRSMELRDIYNTLVGKGSTANLAGASATRDLDVPARFGLPRLWSPSGVR
jgi:hypothetical protein